jgi:hypothetical protein
MKSIAKLGTLFALFALTAPSSMASAADVDLDVQGVGVGKYVDDVDVQLGKGLGKGVDIDIDDDFQDLDLDIDDDFQDVDVQLGKGIVDEQFEDEVEEEVIEEVLDRGPRITYLDGGGCGPRYRGRCAPRVRHYDACDGRRGYCGRGYRGNRRGRW